MVERLRQENARLRTALREQHDVLELYQGLLRTTNDALGRLAAAHHRQQNGNRTRQVVDDGWIADASARHVAGEPWKVIAEAYSLSPSRLRELVRKAGLPTRGHR